MNYFSTFFSTLKKFISGDFLLQSGDRETTLQIGSLPMRSGELTGMALTTAACVRVCVCVCVCHFYVSLRNYKTK